MTTAAMDFYGNRLKKADDAASAARRYLRNRGYDADVVDRFEIGFSPGVLGLHLTRSI